jgi:hypothetical protein
MILLNSHWLLKLELEYQKQSDLVTSKLAALQFYQLSIPAPKPQRQL